MFHGGEWDERCTLWLPELCTRSVLTHEKARFRTLVGAVSAYANNCATQLPLDANQLQQSIPWSNHIHKYASEIHTCVCISHPATIWPLEPEQTRCHIMERVLWRATRSNQSCSLCKEHLIAQRLSLPCRFLKTKTKYDVADVGALYDVAVQMVQATASTVPIMCKWLQVASQILRTYRQDLRGVKTLDMEPYWQLFSNAMDEAQELSFEGALTSSHRPLIAELCKLVCVLCATWSACERTAKGSR